jgi:hypothetical protein
LCDRADAGRAHLAAPPASGRRSWPAAFLLTASIGELWPTLWFDWHWTPLNAVRNRWRTPNGETVNLVEDPARLEHLRPGTRLYIVPSAYSLPDVTSEALARWMRVFDVVLIPANDPAHDADRTPRAHGQRAV